MRTRSKLLLAGFMAALLLSTAVANSSAGRLSVSNRNIRITWNPLRLFIGGLEGTGCPVTMEGSFHSATLRKVAGALIGYISRGTACRGSGFEFLPERFPWHVRYRGFVGSLPTITGIQLGIVGMGFTTGMSGECETTAEEPFVAIAHTDAAGRVTDIRADESRTIQLESEAFCGLMGSGRFAGSGNSDPTRRHNRNNY